MYTIRDLCEKSGLSRSALLYYDSIGILSPTSRSGANYRLYSEEALLQLERICTYREAGVSLDEIGKIFKMGESIERTVLEKTLSVLNSEARKIKQQLEKITAMLQDKKSSISLGIDINSVMSTLKTIGFGTDMLLKVHKMIEDESPDMHRELLTLFDFSDDEICGILSKVQNSDRQEELPK